MIYDAIRCGSLAPGHGNQPRGTVPFKITSTSTAYATGEKVTGMYIKGPGTPCIPMAQAQTYWGGGGVKGCHGLGWGKSHHAYYQNLCFKYRSKYTLELPSLFAF